MKGKTYDLDKLSESGLFDATVMTRFFYNPQEFFDALTDFEMNFNRDLRNYTPAFVMHSEADRELFIKECFAVRAALTRLGMEHLLAALNVLENAAIGKHEKAFSDGQVKFRATIEIYKKTIRESAKPWRMGV